MSTTKNKATRRDGLALVAVLCALGLLVTACGGSAAAPGVGPVATRAAAAPGPAATAVPVAAGGKTTSNLNCAALSAAMIDLIGAEPALVLLTNGNGSAVNRLDSSFYVDTAKIRGDLNVLAALPDPTEATELAMMGRPSEAIAQYRQMLDMIDRAAQAGATLAATVTADASAQELSPFSNKLVKMYTAVTYALDKACPNQPTPAPQANQGTTLATPLTAQYHLGQAAPVGALQVTLDKVTGAPAAALPEPGKRFVIAYFSVENKGTAPFGVTALLNTRFEDAAGTQYMVDPFALSLDVQTTNFDGDMAPGEKRSGAAVYQVPMDATDLLWLFEDARPNQAVFAVPAADVLAVGTAVTEPTAVALRAGAAATQTAFTGTILDAVATQDAMDSTNPQPTDAPAPIDPTDTP